MARKMKDSGIEWIGEIPEGWEVHRVKTHFSIISGSGFKPELQGQSTGDFPVCKASDISSSGHYLHTSANYITSDIVKSQHFSIIPKGSILFAKIGEAMRKNNRSLCLHDCCVDNNCQGLVPKNISSEFSYYLFTCIDMTWFDNAGTIPCINNQKLYDCRIPFPSYDEQLLISNHLNFQCTKINEMLFHIRSSIEEYKKLKQAVITQAVTKGVRGEREMKDSGVEWIGEIPKAWIISNIGRFCFVTKLAGFEYTKEMDGHISPYGDVPIVRAQNIKMGRFIPNTREYISLALSQKLSRCALNEKCLIITFIGAGIGEVALFSDATRHHLAPNVAKIVINHDMKQFLDDRFLLYFLMSSAGQEEVNKIKKATAQPSLSMQTIRSIKLAFPSILQEQKEIADYLDAKCAEINGLIAKKEQLVKELESYKKSLIYEVVTGKREV